MDYSGYSFLPVSVLVVYALQGIVPYYLRQQIYGLEFLYSLCYNFNTHQIGSNGPTLTSNGGNFPCLQSFPGFRVLNIFYRSTVLSWLCLRVCVYLCVYVCAPLLRWVRKTGGWEVGKGRKCLPPAEMRLWQSLFHYRGELC